jgi:hypothetical protein
MKKSIIIIAAICIANFVFAQDIIVKRNHDSLKVKVTEVNIDEIKYHFYNEPNGAAYSIDKAEVALIRFESGRIEAFEVNFLAPLATNLQTKRALKMNLIAPVLGYTKITYEQVLKPGQSLEVTGNFIGLGLERLNAARGFGVSAAYKFIKTPNYYTRGIRTTHQLQGLYVAPTLQLGAFSAMDNHIFDFFDQTSPERTTTTFATGMLFLGSQSVFGNHFLIDVNAGLGIGAVSGTERNLLFGTVGGGGIFFGGNLRIGYSF